MSLSLFSLADFSLSRTAVVLVAVAALASFDLFSRMHRRQSHLLFACIFGTVIAVGLIKTVGVFFQPGLQENPHAMALGLLLIVLCWKALFGPWESQTKAAVLGTFLFWVAFMTLLKQTPEQRAVHLIAAGVALIPAAVWCALFLKYHAERLSNVLLMFFAGMLSTFPILLYDAFVRRGIELQFFLFRITPESFSRTSQMFVSGQVLDGGVRRALFASLISFLIVGLIEEVSKYWVLSRSGRRLFTSIDDALQLSIIVAIGFAFAENVINPVYFPGFVREYLMGADPNVPGFIGNVLGRSVLTSMVHIVSTGICGYFLGLSIFAAPYLAERRAQGKHYHVIHWCKGLFGMEETSIFRIQMLVTGLASAILLHAAFNFLVTFPDVIPGNPTTLGELLGKPNTVLNMVPLLLFPSLFYVVGGFWLLSWLFLRKESMEERGRVVPVNVLITES